MSKWIPFAVTALLCLLGGWLLGRLQPGESESAEFAVGPEPESSTVLVRRAHRLWQVNSDRTDGRQVLRFMSHLAESLDDASWWAVSGACLQAWNRLHDAAPLQGPIKDANRVLIPRFLRSGGVEECSSLLERLTPNSFDAAQIQDTLEKAVADPLPQAGFEGSIPERIVAATIRSGDLTRAGSYLAKVSWPKDLSPEARGTAVRPVQEVIEIGLEAAGGKVDVRRLIGSWQRHSPAPLGRTCLQPSLENAVMPALAPTGRTLLPRIEELFQASAAEAGAEAFWARILLRVRPGLLRSGEFASLDTESLVRLFAARYQKPRFEFEFWMGVGDISWRWSPDDPRRAARFYRRALRGAGTDKDRGAAVKQFAFHCQRAGEPESALLAVREAADKVQDPDVRKELSQLTDELMNTALKSNKEAAASRNAERERQLKVIAQMREVLFTARKENRPAEEIKSIESVIRDLETQIKD